ncbi:hypothetical protein F8M41_019429 [Gigaspora margarita]|nr:hypothetical protein F8M41_019429 [Gigaspora margarita]
MTIPFCKKHDTPEQLAAVRTREYLQPLATQISMPEASLNSLSKYLSDRIKEERPIQTGIFYVLRRTDIKDNPNIFKIGLDIGDAEDNFEKRISQHEDGKCAAVFAEGYVTPVHEDSRIVDSAIKRILNEFRVKFNCNCNTNHVEYYDVNSLSTFDEVESWFYANPVRLLVSKIQHVSISQL